MQLILDIDIGIQLVLMYSIYVITIKIRLIEEMTSSIYINVWCSFQFPSANQPKIRLFHYRAQHNTFHPSFPFYYGVIPSSLLVMVLQPLNVSKRLPHHHFHRSILFVSLQALLTTTKMYEANMNSKNKWGGKKPRVKNRVMKFQSDIVG